MHDFIDFLRTEHILAFLTALIIFTITLILVIRKTINFSIALLLLVFSLAAGLAINNHDAMRCYVQGRFSEEDQQGVFKQQLVDAFEELKLEVLTEKEQLHKITIQVQDLIDQVDVQKHKLQHFIEETREQFKTDSSTQTEKNSISDRP